MRLVLLICLVLLSSAEISAAYKDLTILRKRRQQIVERKKKALEIERAKEVRQMNRASSVQRAQQYVNRAREEARRAVMLSGPYAGRKVIVLSSGVRRRLARVFVFPKPVTPCELVFRILQWNLIKAGKKIDAQKIEEYKQGFKKDVAVLPEYELQKRAVLEKRAASKALKNARRLRMQQATVSKKSVRFDMGKNYARQGKPIQQITGGR